MDVDVAQLVALVRSEVIPLVRTDGADGAGTAGGAWQRVIAAVCRAVDLEDPANPDPGDDGYLPSITPVDDPALAGSTGETLASHWPSGDAVGYVLLADARSMLEASSDQEPTVVFVDLSVSDPEDAELVASFLGRTFRCAAHQVASVEANLAVANMDFGEFADSVDADGVFRGFP